MFVEGINHVTKGYGVDVVLNSLSGDGLRAFWDCIAPYGRFIEIGKADITTDASITRENLKKNSGKSACRIVISFDASNVGPTYRTRRSWWKFHEDASYVVAGDLGGLGRAIILWMAEKGVKHLTIPSRSGASSKVAEEAIESLRKRGVNVSTTACDVSLMHSLLAALDACRDTIPPVKGCINSPMALQVFKAMSFDIGWIRDIGIIAESEAYEAHRRNAGDMQEIQKVKLLAVVGIFCDPRYSCLGSKNPTSHWYDDISTPACSGTKATAEDGLPYTLDSRA
ncbi:hypothetical protein DL765_003412 [Monosporascus sp. GIB2]|nr:hypothetical protein DL765_003412 [Monosporascus sp. GIB2]